MKRSFAALSLVFVLLACSDTGEPLTAEQIQAVGQLVQATDTAAQLESIVSSSPTVAPNSSPAGPADLVAEDMVREFIRDFNRFDWDALEPTIMAKGEVKIRDGMLHAKRHGTMNFVMRSPL